MDMIACQGELQPVRSPTGYAISTDRDAPALRDLRASAVRPQGAWSGRTAAVEFSRPANRPPGVGERILQAGS
jgi:hypothetical protein